MYFGHDPAPNGTSESIFCFSENILLEYPVPDDDDEDDAEFTGEGFCLFEIVMVVSSSLKTDWLVFKVSSSAVGLLDFKTPTPQSGLKRSLQLPHPDQPSKHPLWVAHWSDLVLSAMGLLTAL